MNTKMLLANSAEGEGEGSRKKGNFVIHFDVATFQYKNPCFFPIGLIMERPFKRALRRVLLTRESGRDKHALIQPNELSTDDESDCESDLYNSEMPLTKRMREDLIAKLAMAEAVSIISFSVIYILLR